MKFTATIAIAFVALGTTTANGLEMENEITIANKLEGGRHCYADDVVCRPNGRFYKTCVDGRFRVKRFDNCESCAKDDQGKRFISDTCKYTVRIDNLTFQQPLGPIFVMIHNENAEALYEMGDAASVPLADLAQGGNPTALVTAYDGAKGVLSATAVFLEVQSGAFTEFEIELTSNFQFMSIGSMAINSNDCFVGLNGVQIDRAGSVFQLPGLDAGSEPNDELCTSIPGPACPTDSGNASPESGEGFVHIHRGFHGVNSGRTDLTENELGNGGTPLSAAGYDWRNPMARVTVTPIA